MNAKPQLTELRNAWGLASQGNLADALDQQLAETVVKLKPVPASRPNANHLADLHRRESNNCQQRIADARRVLKVECAAAALARKTAKAVYDAEILAIFEAEQFARERTAISIAEDERLQRYNAAALGALAE